MRVLFLCTGNSCRSQMAEGIGRSLAAPGVEVWSAGTRPVGVHPRARVVLAERGIDTSTLRSKGLDDVPADPELVVTLCDDAARTCPPFGDRTAVVHLPVDDPASATGSEESVLAVFRSARDEIEGRLRALFAGRGLLRAEEA
ncbi:MAG: arsenate reductase ArsC [Planctomycetota bacterium JB042]